MINAITKAELKRKYPTEQVFVTSYLEAAKEFPDGFVMGGGGNLKRYDQGEGKFVLRHDAEYNHALIQLIPYILVLNSKHSKIYVARRIAGDKRLVKKWSFFGGHINPCDSHVGGIILNAAKRELNEELEIKFIKHTKYVQIGSVGDIVSPTSEHAGIVYVVTAKSAKIKEKDKLEGKWMSYSDLVNKYAEFESWAQHIIDWIFLEHNDDDEKLIHIPEKNKKKRKEI